MEDWYAWLSDVEEPCAREQIRKENEYFCSRVAPLAELRERLFREMCSRLDPDANDLPTKHGGYYYYSAFGGGNSYRAHYRSKHENLAEPELLVDENELAADHDYFCLAVLSVSPDHHRCAFAVDTVGDERLTLFVRALDENDRSTRRIADAVGSVAWASDSRTLFYTRLDERNRPRRVVRVDVADESASDKVVYEEADEAFRLGLARSESGGYVVLTAAAYGTSEVRYLPAAQTLQPFRLLCPRQPGTECYLTHSGDYFYVLMSGEAAGAEVFTVPVGDADRASWRSLIRPPPNVTITGLQAFAGHLALFERADSLPRLRIVALDTGEQHLVKVPNRVCTLYPGDNREFATPVLRFGYDSLVIPFSVYEYDMCQRSLALKRRWQVRGYRPAAFRSERLLVSSSDGTEVPLSLVYREDLGRGRAGPAVLYAYGAYGVSLDAEFSALRLSLLERGILFAIAHVRGGGELGRTWHAAGKGRLKSNGIADFLACAKFLTGEGYTEPMKLAAIAESAGAILLGAALNRSPELFRAMALDSPFLDPVNTLLDSDLPFTTSEWDEWGNPREEADYRNIKAYSPYENITGRPYWPDILVLCSLNDPRVPYWEALKWVAKARDHVTNGADIILGIRDAAGHQGVSGRFAELEEQALTYSFIVSRIAPGR